MILAGPLDLKIQIHIKILLALSIEQWVLPDLYLNFEETINSLIWFPSWVKNYFLHVEFLYISTLIIISSIIFIILDNLIVKKIIFNNNLKTFLLLYLSL